MKIVILEDNAERQMAMRSCLAERFYQYEHRFFSDASSMIDFLQDNLKDALVIGLDNDLELQPDHQGRWVDPGTGRDVADYLAVHDPVCPVVIHTSNSAAAEGMVRVLQDAHWKTHRVYPFDDLTWIATDWFRTVRQAILAGALPAKGHMPSR